MPQKLGDHIATALERAAAAEQRAREVINPELRLENKRMAESWRLLARGSNMSKGLSNNDPAAKYPASEASEEASLGMIVLRIRLE
jgi:hypothetical protein